MNRNKPIKKLQLAVLTILAALVMFSEGWAATYYASPSGSGTTCSSGSPCSVSYALNTKMSDSDDLVLKDGTYQGSDYMIRPPSSLDGVEGNPVTISAENDGKVLIDGQDTRIPVSLEGNDWFVLEGFNAANNNSSSGEGRIINLYNTRNCIVRRVIGWDANPVTNSMIFNVGGSSTANSVNNLFEDCAGWGPARKIFQNHKCTGATFRRCFARWTYYNNNIINYQMGMTIAYDSEDTIIENCIVTWDAYPTLTKSGMLTVALFGDDEANPAGSPYKLYGSIGYILDSQNVSNGAPQTLCHFKEEGGYEPGTTIDIRNLLLYTNSTDGRIAMYMQDEDFLGDGITIIGGGNLSRTDGNAITTNVGSSVFNNAIMVDSIDTSYSVNRGDDWDYIMLYNNSSSYGSSAPTHYTTGTDPDLVGKCGNILQYGLAEENRPKVNGQSVGAKIQHRYVDGILTETELWPWPMDERIKNAMIESGYDKKGGLDGKGGIALTKTIFELDGGTMPSHFGSESPPNPPQNLIVR
jgi:hypothetical protein